MVEAEVLPLALLTAAGVPTAYALAVPWPNPSRGAVHVRYALPSASAVRVEVVDLLGRRVSVVADGEQAAGWHEARLDGGALAAGQQPGLSTVLQPAVLLPLVGLALLALAPIGWRRWKAARG